MIKLTKKEISDEKYYWKWCCFKWQLNMPFSKNVLQHQTAWMLWGRCANLNTRTLLKRHLSNICKGKTGALLARCKIRQYLMWDNILPQGHMLSVFYVRRQKFSNSCHSWLHKLAIVGSQLCDQDISTRIPRLPEKFTYGSVFASLSSLQLLTHVICFGNGSTSLATTYVDIKDITSVF